MSIYLGGSVAVWRPVQVWGNNVNETSRWVGGWLEALRRHACITSATQPANTSDAENSLASLNAELDVTYILIALNLAELTQPTAL